MKKLAGCFVAVPLLFLLLTLSFFVITLFVDPRWRPFRDDILKELLMVILTVISLVMAFVIFRSFLRRGAAYEEALRHAVPE